MLSSAAMFTCKWNPRACALIRQFHVVSSPTCGRKSEPIDLGINFKYPLRRHNNYEDEHRQYDSRANNECRPAVIQTARSNPESYLRKRSRNQKPFRDKHSEPPFETLFGISPVTLALQTGRRVIHKLYLRKHSVVNQRLETIETLATTRGITVQRVDIDKLDHLSGGRPHQGTCLDVDELPYSVDDLSNYESDGDGLIWLFLDKIHDPMNLGAIIRSAYYFGANRIITVDNNTCPLTAVVSKASSGAMEIVDVYRTPNSVELLKEKANKGWSIIGTASEDNLDKDDIQSLSIVRLGEYQWPQKTIVLIGNEGMGLSMELQQLCDNVLTIPAGQTLHPQMRSLNVGVATGIILQNHRLQFRI